MKASFPTTQDQFIHAKMGGMETDFLKEVVKSALRSLIRNQPFLISVSFPSKCRARAAALRTNTATRLLRRAQYSSASMIVITRLVTDGSVGSGEW
jgi:hypothetical protein